MPNSRRRRFSVHNGIAGKDHCKGQSGLQTSSASETDSDVKRTGNIFVATSQGAHSASITKNRMPPNSSNNLNNLTIIADYPSSSSMFIVKNNSNPTVDKDVTASSSSINLFNMLNASDGIPDLSLSQENTDNIETQTKQVRHLARDKTPRKLDKFPQQHRVKVRSPKQRAPTLDSQNNIQPQSNNITTCSVGMDAIDWGTEVEICVHNSENIVEIEDEERQSDHSLDDMCRICHGGDGLSQELGPLISACACRGTVGRVHVKCLERWLTESGKSRCELCGMKYTTRRVHRYGVPRALVMWILSQNAKQLMVDSLGIMLMSPLAVLAAWLSGRTLAGLMTPDNRSTPWPLASTFVLACMTLVCYYCWIVSAATRHALGWWVWYRSQYEVRLTLENEE